MDFFKLKKKTDFCDVLWWKNTKSSILTFKRASHEIFMRINFNFSEECKYTTPQEIG